MAENIIKTKIVCTIGPASDNADKLKEMLKAGMNVARFNFAHGTHETHKKTLDLIRSVSKEIGIPVAILFDTKGPEIRTGKTKTGKITLEEGKEIIITTDEVEGTEQMLSVSYKQIDKEVSAGNHILIADGSVDLEVISVSPKEIKCKVIVGGEFGDRKNVNIPNVKVGLPAITEKDMDDILFGIREDVDFIAHSFVRKAEDVMELRKILNENNSKIHIISKIENEEGVTNIDDIINHSDGIMVARGDLGVQIPVCQIPLIQKRIIGKCNLAKKPVITATQMLDSMIYNPRPTRAETTDVANAIIDGTDAVMLSGETANGKYPVESVKMMKQIAKTIEESSEYKKTMEKRFRVLGEAKKIEDTLCYSATLTANNINAAAILTPTLSGNTARLLSRYRLPQPIIAVTAKEKTRNQLLLSADVTPILSKFAEDTTEMLNTCLKEALKSKLVHNFDKVVIVAGVPVNSRNAVNLVKVSIIANILTKGSGIKGKQVSGSVVKAQTPEEAMSKLGREKDEILVVPYLNKRMEHFLASVKGVIVKEVSILSIEELNRYPDLVVITEVKDAMERLEDELCITLDGTQGLIYEGEIED